MRISSSKVSILLLFALLLAGCKESYTPKPFGYFRIELPQKNYTRVGNDLPYSFELPSYATIEVDKNKNAELYWINVQFKRFNSTLHISYKPITNNLNQIVDDSHNMAYKHSVKADAIKESGLYMPEKRVFGLLYEIKGDAASSIQFTATDSVNHFVRGALYFNSIPNKDSLAPVIQFLKTDVVRFMESLEWQKL